MPTSPPPLPLTIETLSLREAGAGYDIELHSHSVWQMYLLISGHVSMRYAKDVIPLTAGDHILIPPYVPRGPYCSGDAPIYLVAIFNCDDLPLAPLAGRPLAMRSSTRPLFNALLEEIRRPGAFSQRYRTTLLYQWLLTILRGAGQASHRGRPAVGPNAATQQDLIERAEAYMTTNLHRALARDEVADAVYYSPTHLARIFRAVRGVSWGQRLTELRLDRARALLRDTDLPVTQIGEEVGYASFSHFTQTFRRHIGMSPSAFRSATPDPPEPPPALA